jgi:hypothetical protein
MAGVDARKPTAAARDLGQIRNIVFDPSEPESYRKDVSNAEVHIVDGGHFALDTAANEIAALVTGFMVSSRSELKARRAG